METMGATAEFRERRWQASVQTLPIILRQRFGPIYMDNRPGEYYDLIGFLLARANFSSSSSRSFL